MSTPSISVHYNSNSTVTSTHQSILLKIGRKLRDYIDHLSSTQNERARDLSTRVLDCLSFYRQSKELASAEELFLTLLMENKGDVGRLFNRILSICQKGHGTAFLKCASTKKNKLNSYEIVEKITLYFEEILNKSSSTDLSDCPPYDEGGAEVLSFIATNPTLFNGIPAQDKPNCSPGLFVLPIPTRKDVLNSKLFLSDFKSLALRYLVSIPGQQRLCLEVYTKLFDYLENELGCQDLQPILKNAIAKLLILSTSKEGEKGSELCSFESFREIINECLGFSEKLGEDRLLSFCSICSENNERTIDHIHKALSLVNLQLPELNTDTSVQVNLDRLLAREISLTQFIQELSKGIPHKDFESNRDEDEIQKIISRFRRDSSVVFPLPEEALHRVEKQYQTIQSYCHEWRFLSMQELIRLAKVFQEKCKEGSLSQDQVLQLIAIGRLALRHEFNLYPYNTQILGLLGLLSSGKDCFAQIKTGQGKSMIVAILAFVMAIRGKVFHIISHSQNEAKVQQKAFFHFFARFDIHTSHICVQDRQPCHFVGNILYGTSTDYEFAIMDEMLNFTPLFPTRTLPSVNGKRFDCAIIDEGDNLTIDTALNHARLSYPAENTYDWVYVPIFQFVMENISFSQKKDLTDPIIIDKLKMYLQRYQNGTFCEAALQLPTDKLAVWLQSAFHAIYESKENKDYVVQAQKDEKNGSHRKIVIVDAKNTGRLMHGSRWSSGIHEFLEVKHGIEVHRESVMPLSLSHSVFYGMYDMLLGLTGTLGSFDEREELKDIYRIESFDVPTHQPIQRYDAPEPIILPTDEEVLQAIVQRVNLYQGKGRPFLVLCETIEDSLTISGALKTLGIPHETLNEIQEKDEEEIVKNAGEPGAITVATNTACRATDIKLVPVSQTNGGLHVAMTFDPESDRVRDQARGRAGRQGQPGSTEIILSAQRLGLTNLNSESIRTYLKYLEKRRESSARVRRFVHTCRADLERFFYSFVKEFYENLHNFMKAATSEGFIMWSAPYKIGPLAC